MKIAAGRWETDAALQALLAVNWLQLGNQLKPLEDKVAGDGIRGIAIGTKNLE